MCRRRGRRCSASLSAVTLASTSATLSAQQNGSIYTQCPGDTNGDGVPDVVVAGHPNVKCMHLAGGDGFITMADGQADLHLRLLGRHRAAALGGRERHGRPGGCRGDLPGADHPPEGRAGVLPVAHQRRDDPAPRPVRPALGPLPRLPAGGVGLRRRARVLRDHQHGLDLHLLLQHRRRPGRHLHVPLPRRGHRAHPDGDGRQPLHRPEAERAAARTPTAAAQAPTTDQCTPTTTATAPPVTTSSTRSSSAPSTRTSTTSTSPSSRCRSRPWTTSYPLLNGRGYPGHGQPERAINTDAGFGNLPSQPLNSKIAATAGQKVLLRLSNLAVTRFYTLGSTIPMQVVGHNAKLLRGPDGGARQTSLQDELGDARRRRVRRRDPRHHGRRAGHLPPLHDEPQLPEQRR